MKIIAIQCSTLHVLTAGRGRGREGKRGRSTDCHHCWDRRTDFIGASGGFCPRTHRTRQH